MTIAEGKVGLVSLADGVASQLRFDKTGALVVTEGHGRYQEAVLRGNVYSAMNQTGCVWTVGLATTFTGLCVSNPNGSGKILSIIGAGFYEVVAPAGIQAVGLAVGYSTTEVTHSVPGTPRNMLIGGAGVGLAKCDTGATLPVAPTYVMALQTGKTSAALSTASALAHADIGGLIQLKPGAFIIICCFTVGGAAGSMGSFVWEELPE